MALKGNSENKMVKPRLNKRYRVLTGVSYEPKQGQPRRFEPGDVIGVDDMRGNPPLNIDWLLSRGAIEEVV